jgi:hypothetical protein
MSTVTLCRPQSETEAGLIQGLLDNAGIRSVQRRLSMWELDGVAGVAYGAWGEIWVDSADLDRAAEVLGVLQSMVEAPNQAVLETEDIEWRKAYAMKRLRIRQVFWGIIVVSVWVPFFYGLVLSGAPSPAEYWTVLLILMAPPVIALLYIARMRPHDGFIRHG